MRLSSFLLALIVFPLPGFAQVFDMEKDRVPMTELSGPVHFHTGDDADGKLGWASPNFDDSSWALIGSGKSWSEQGYKDYGGFAWYRFRVVLPRNHRQLGLYLPMLPTSYQVFAGGRLIGQTGGLPPRESVRYGRPHWFRLPAETTDAVVIAIRVWHWPHWAMYVPGGFIRAPRIGDADLIADWYMRSDKFNYWLESAISYAAFISVLAGIAGILLYLLRRKEREFLFFGAYEIFSGAAGLVLLYREFHDTPLHLYEIPQELLGCAAELCFVAFLFLAVRGRRSKWYWFAVASVVVYALLVILDSTEWLSVSVINGLAQVVMLPYYLTILLMLIQGARRRDPDARLLLIPVGLDYAVVLVGAIAWVIASSGRDAAQHFFSLWQRVGEWPFPIGMPDIAAMLMQLSIFGILLLRFARSRRDEERLKNELEAARAVQQVLVPSEIPTIPGFAISAVYKPATQVGGDLFQIMPARSGGVLVVIGDVSGKGMPAAMTVSLLVGTIRTLTRYTDNPGEILAAMNQQMLARSAGGFTTCLALMLDADGTMTMANAGHIAPYLNGAELTTENGLPLGLSPESTYAESTFHLKPDEQLTLMSDGVVEARDRTGELFGFQRIADIALGTAESIASSAQEFGQEDDITVVTLTRRSEGPHPVHLPAPAVSVEFA